MVLRDNMSDRRGLIIALSEGPVLTFQHIGTSRLGCISPPIPVLSAAFGAVIPFVKVNVFFPACAGLRPTGNLILQMNGLH